MKRTIISVVAAVMVLYAVYAFGPNTAQVSQSTRAIAQEPAAPKGSENPFADPSDSPRDTPPESTSPEKGVKPKGDSPRNPAKPNDDLLHEPAHPSEALEAKLSRPDNFEFSDVPLQDVIDSLAAKYGIPFILDKKAFEDAGIGTDAIINFNLRGICTDKFLDLMLGDELVWVTRDGYVFITTKEKLGELLEVRVYNCSDLIEMIKAKTPAHKETPSQMGGSGGLFGVEEAPAGAARGGATIPAAGSAPGVPSTTLPGGGVVGFPGAVPGAAGQLGVPAGMPGLPPMGNSGGGLGMTSEELVPDTASLIDLIQSTVETDTWDVAGGHGSIQSYHGGLLVINQHGPAHRRVEMLLNMMRQAKQAKPGTVVRER